MYYGGTIKYYTVTMIQMVIFWLVSMVQSAPASTYHSFNYSCYSHIIFFLIYLLMKILNEIVDFWVRYIVMIPYKKKSQCNFLPIQTYYIILNYIILHCIALYYSTDHSLNHSLFFLFTCLLINIFIISHIYGTFIKFKILGHLILYYIISIMWLIN